MPRLRTFLAIELSDAIRDRLISLQEQLAIIASDVKWVEPDNLHITLLFLGEVDERETLDICREAQRAVANMSAFHLTVEGTGCFPNARRPRTLWVGIGAGAEEVCAIHDAIEKPLMEMGTYRRETRGYVPHVTLGRVKGDRPTEELVKAIAKHKSWSGGETSVHDVCVMSSVLMPEGPTYTVLGRAKLLA